MTVVETITPVRSTEDAHWTTACALSQLLPGVGVGVLLPGLEQVALFMLDDGSLRAVSNIDPFAKAAVLARGIVGDHAGVPTVASPLLKQVFSLDTGRCLDVADVEIPTYAVRVRDGLVEIAHAERPGADA